MSTVRHDISGPGYLRAVQAAHASKKRLVLAVDRDPSGRIVRIGYYLDSGTAELTQQPVITWFRAGEIEIKSERSVGPHLAASRMDIGFKHPRDEERHLLVDLPAGANQTIVLRVLFRLRANGATEFVIQAEVRGLIKGKLEWRPVVRYDCAHGFIHRDLIGLHGDKSKEPMPVASPREAIPLAISEMRQHLGQWLVELGYDEPDAGHLDHPSIAEELESAQRTLLHFLEDPQSVQGVSSRLVLFGQDAAGGADWNQKGTTVADSAPLPPDTRISIGDPCTCGSGKPVKDCCFRKLDTQPPPPTTGFSHPKCYARALGDCSSTISGEHFISKGVLELIGDTAVVCTPFLEKGGKRLHSTSMFSKVLCTRHNEALSPLDDLAKRFFEFVLGRTKHEALIVRGSELERWLLKLMCGFIATGYGQTPRGVLIAGREPPLAALATLFGTHQLPEGWGLTIPEKPGRYLRDAYSFHVLADDQHARGIGIRIKYMELLFVLQPMPQSLDDGTRLHYHPSSLGLTVGERYREVHLGWPEGEHVALVFTEVAMDLPSEPTAGDPEPRA